MDSYHKSVLLNEVIGFLERDEIKGRWFLDATLGDGGYALLILKKRGKVIGTDVDPQALGRSKRRFEDEGIGQDNFKLIRGNFRDIDNLISQTDAKIKFAAAILDLGVSGLQLETPQRGFSFTREAPLDMRMDPNLEVRALDLINGLNKGELYELFNKLGEEKFAKAIADLVVFTRSIKRIETTKELADLGVRVYRKFGRKEKIHPATRVFQALRIAVNDELNALKEGLPQILGRIEKNGLILVISFHSLEDRIVKDTFREWQNSGLGEVLTKKPVVAGETELNINPRTRSAKLRVFKKTWQ